MSEVKLVDLSTNETKTATLVGVDLEELDSNTVNVVYGFFARSAETDNTLSNVDYNRLRYATLSLSECSCAIVQKLQIYGDLVENLVEKDEDIREADNMVIESMLSSAQEGEEREGEEREGEETDAGEQRGFDYRAMQNHLFTILERFFSRERVMNCSPMRLLIDLALVIKYCYNFCKRLMEQARQRLTTILRDSLPAFIFEMLTNIVSAIFAHLVRIQWKTIVANVGGWISLAGSVALTKVTQDVLGISPYQPSLYLGIAVISIGVGTYLYYKQR